MSLPEFTPSPARPDQSPVSVYMRLVGYAWRYKGRLLLSLLLSLVIAISTGGLLLTLGQIVNIALYDPAVVADEARPAESAEVEAPPKDPAEDILGSITKLQTRLRASIGWAPEQLDEQFLSLVERLRGQRMMALKMVCVLPPVGYILIRIGKKMRRSVRRSLEKIGAMASVVNETVVGISIVKGYTMEQYEIGRLKREIHRLQRFLIQMVRLDALAGPVTQFVLLLGIALFLWLSAERVESGDLEIGHLITLFTALAMMLDPIRKLASVNNMVQTSVASAERVFAFIDMRPEILEKSSALTVPPMQQSMTFQNVSFSYDGKAPVLQGVNLEFRRGETVALVGFSGAGKSTLVKLIPRFYDVTEGALLIDGVNVRDMTFQSLRDQISIVTQHTILFSETIRANIAYGRTQYSDERIREAAQAANALEFIDKLPQGLDTLLNESGNNLSGGQRQRLAIARAFIRDPAILILDEATSSLDSESERLIQDALEHFLEGRTAIIIAHRLSTIQRADRIVVLDAGHVTQQGTHAELMQMGGIYRRLYETQFGPQEKTP